MSTAQVSYLHVWIYQCDICNDKIEEIPDDIESKIDILKEIDDSFESEYDKSTHECGPKLLLCDYCKNTFYQLMNDLKVK